MFKSKAPIVFLGAPPLHFSWTPSFAQTPPPSPVKNEWSLRLFLFNAVHPTTCKHDLKFKLYLENGVLARVPGLSNKPFHFYMKIRSLYGSLVEWHIFIYQSIAGSASFTTGFVKICMLASHPASRW